MHMHASRRRHRRLCWLQENIYRHPEGGGAGNNWAMGYDMAQSVQEDILEMIDREVARIPTPTPTPNLTPAPAPTPNPSPNPNLNPNLNPNPSPSWDPNPNPDPDP